MWLPVIIIFVGGGLGAITRELSMLLMGRYSVAFPVDIFAANIFASFLLGLVFGLHQARRASDNVTLLVSTGFCGGMSTFSTFIYGAYSEMVTPGQLGLSFLYVIASLVIGYSVTWLGLGAATQLRRA
ncbi:MULTISPECIES: CrcB family protein [Ancylobacter]|uniref:Fluoride-specific ion channel FluC n=1 Tax=Ancylobacter oerskovii TaxID=459519 RepID=A0ABW4Z5K9_9HYPH|nr:MULTISPECIES: CrcB family protein [Ancylobacter]MBS7544048.1 CrcB family protein [Ancylobacter oerskovii]MDR6955739.1 CrcB protein [Ancylobacter sp. 3268]